MKRAEEWADFMRRNTLEYLRRTRLTVCKYGFASLARSSSSFLLELSLSSFGSREGEKGRGMGGLYAAKYFGKSIELNLLMLKV